MIFFFKFSLVLVWSDLRKRRISKLTCYSAILFIISRTILWMNVNIGTCTQTYNILRVHWFLQRFSHGTKALNKKKKYLTGKTTLWLFRIAVTRSLVQILNNNIWHCCLRKSSAVPQSRTVPNRTEPKRTKTSFMSGVKGPSQVQSSAKLFSISNTRNVIFTLYLWILRL